MSDNVLKRSKYMGSVITPENRKSFEKLQMDYFKDRYIADVSKKRDAIISQNDKSEDEIDLEVSLFNSEQISEENLEEVAKRFAIYQVNKENKHYKSWLRGKQSFKYKGTTFPVMTEKFLENSKSIKEIVKV